MLGVKGSLQFHDVVGGPVSEPGRRPLAFVGLRMGFTREGLKYYPKLDAPKRRIPFDPWWDGIVMLQGQSRGTVRRKDAVLLLANTDGGAHVDPTLDASYAALSRDPKFGWTVIVGGKPGIVENSPILPFVRQTAHELAETLHEQIPELVDPAEGPPGFRASAT